MLGEEQELIYGGGTKILCLLSHTFLSHSHTLSFVFFPPTFIVFHSRLTFSLSHSHALSPLSTRTNPFSLFVTCLQISALTVIIDTIQDYVIYICIYVYIYRTILNCIIWEKTRVNSSTADVGFRFVPLSLSRLFSSPSFYLSLNFIPLALNFISRLRFSYPLYKRMTHSRRVFLELSSRDHFHQFIF